MINLKSLIFYNKSLTESESKTMEIISSTKEFLTSILDSREIIQAFDFSGEDECKAMFDLIEEIEGDSLRLDAGFNSRKLVRKIAE